MIEYVIITGVVIGGLIWFIGRHYRPGNVMIRKMYKDELKELKGEKE